MALHEKKSNPWRWVLGLIILGVVVLFACCDFMPKPQTVERQIVHTAD